MGSPKVLAQANGSPTELACSSKSVIPPLFRAERPLAGAPSRFRPAQRTQALEAKRNPLLRRWSRRTGTGFSQGSKYVSTRAFRCAPPGLDVN